MGGFLGRSLAGWYARFCDGLRKGTDDPFYLALADFLEGVMKKYMEFFAPVKEKA